jgi:type VI secretion system protein ImpG
MDPRLLDCYNKELLYMHEAAAEFAASHPKIARRLGMHGTEVADPYVERLIEAFSFLSARMQIKLDAEFPRFTQRLLEVLYPNYLSPTPSMAVAQLHPSVKEGDFTRGFVVPRGTAFHARVPPGEETPCEFRSSQDVTLWPLEIVDARLTGAPPDIPALERYLPPHVQVAGALRLRLRIVGEMNFSTLSGLDRLPVYLRGNEQVASHLFELLHTSAVATFVGVPGQLADRPHVVTEGALVHEGLGPGEGLLPLEWNTFHGHNLLHEYFACPERFYFFTLTQLAAGLARVHGKEAEIVVLLGKPPGALGASVDAGQFALFSTPVVNLFERRTDRIALDEAQPEFHLVPDRSRPLDFEVYAVRRIAGQQAQTTAELDFRPLYQTLNEDEGNHGRYFSVRREQRLASNTSRKYGTRTPYIGTEVFLSLVDQHEAPYPESLRYLSVKALLTNRDLPCLVPRNGHSDLAVSDSVPVSAVGLIRPPSTPKPPFAQREIAWRLIRQLGFQPPAAGRHAAPRGRAGAARHAAAVRHGRRRGAGPADRQPGGVAHRAGHAAPAGRGAAHLRAGRAMHPERGRGGLLGHQPLPAGAGAGALPGAAREHQRVHADGARVDAARHGGQVARAHGRQGHRLKAQFSAC